MKLYAFSAEDIYDHLDKNLKSHKFDGKCGSCNWETERFYVLAGSKEEAFKIIKQVVKDGGSPLCGACMCDMLSEENYTIAPNDNLQTNKTPDV